jgi:DUF971 family protein
MPAIPAAVRVNVTTGSGMEIDWSDGHQSRYSFQYLRDNCPCAMCDDEREKSGSVIGQPKKAAPGALPLYKDPARPQKVEPVGKYAISFVWNDGHQSGIYTWDFLRTYCPCEACSSARKAE